MKKLARSIAIFLITTYIDAVYRYTGNCLLKQRNLCRSCRRLRSFDLDLKKTRSRDRSLRQLLRGDVSPVLLHRQEIQEQQTLGVVQANAPITLVEHLGQQVQARDDLAELHGETQVAALL